MPKFDSSLTLAKLDGNEKKTFYLRNGEQQKKNG